MRKNRRVMAVLTTIAVMLASFIPLGVSAEDGKDVPKIVLSVGDDQETPEYQAGEKNKELSLQLKNKGVEGARKITVEPVMDNSAEWPFEIGKMNYTEEIESLAAAGEEGDTQSVQFKGLEVKKDVQSAYYKLRFKITYRNSDNTKEYQTEKYIFVKAVSAAKDPVPPAPDPEPQPDPEPVPTPVPGDDGSDYSGGGDVSGGSGSAGSGDTKSSSVPRVIVTGFSTEPAVVKAGTDFKLIIHLKNTSKETQVKNMVFNLEAPTEGSDAATSSPAFLPSSGSSSIYLDQIPADGAKDIEIMLNAKSDLVQKPYSINVTMKYEDKAGAQYDSSSSVSIPVKQDPRYEFSEIEASPETIEIGTESNVMCSLHNLGRIKLYNVKVRFEGDGISGKEIFVGNVDSGATASIDGMVTGESVTTGDGTVKMIMTFEDEEGKVSTAEKTFTMFVTEPAMDEGFPVDGIEPEAKKFPVVPAVIAGVVVAGIIVTVVVLKKRKKRKLQEEEDELTNELD